MTDDLPEGEVKRRLQLLKTKCVGRPLFADEYQAYFQEQFLEFGIEVSTYPYGNEIGKNQITANGYFCSQDLEEEEDTDIELVLVLNSEDQTITINNSDWDFLEHQVRQTLEHEMIHREQATQRLGTDIMPIFTQHMDDEQKRIVYLSDPDEIDAYAPVLNDIVATCRAQNLPTDVATIEYAPGQFEINLHHTDDPVAACDHAMLQKRAIKGVAAKHGMTATFMARPFREHSTNGTHIHLSLLDDQGRNVFNDGSARGSKLFRHAIGGLASTMAEAMPIWAPNANSFRRITPTGWVPLAPTWGYNNRTVSLRVPGGPKEARRIEHRPAGADANPYLVLAAVLAGIHHGLVNKVDPGEPIEGNAAEQVDPSLPSIWVDALRTFDRAEVLPEYFGSRYWDVYSKLKWSEFHEFNDHISKLEYDRLLTLV